MSNFNIANFPIIWFVLFKACCTVMLVYRLCNMSILSTLNEAKNSVKGKHSERNEAAKLKDSLQTPFSTIV